MGMTCTLRRASEADIQRLLAAPEEVGAFLYGTNAANSPDVEVIRPRGLLGCLLRIFPITIEQVRPSPAAGVPPEQPPQQDGSGEDVDLDKAWHGLQFLFTGTAWEGDEPGCFLVRGGEEVGDEDSGPARVLRPEQVRQFAAFLAELSAEELTRRYDPERMTALEIYPEVIWKRPATDGESALDYLLDFFGPLRTFVTAAAASGDCLVVSVV